MEINFYDLSVKNPSGNPIKMSDFKGKAVLIVNTATKCGLAPQFEGLEELHQKYKDRGLIVLGFPCNQFQNQEPESNETMQEACAINFGVSFPLTEKIDVNGKYTHPVFKFLKEHLSGFPGRKIKWNFTKFLITRDGKPYKRFAPIVKPNTLEEYIEKIL